MRGDTPCFAKIIHLFIDVDGMVGQDFAAGPAGLSSIAGKRAAGAGVPH